MHMVHKASDGSLLVRSSAASACACDLQSRVDLQAFGVFLEIDSSDDGSAPASPLMPVFEAIPVLAHDVEVATKQQKDGSGKAQASMPLLGFNIRALLQFFEDNAFSSR